MGTAPATHSLTAPTVNALADGLNKGEFVPFYQPLWDVLHQCWEGAETLIRWQHPTEGLIQSDTFIPVAEQSGLILELGAFVLRAACQQMMHWRQRGLPEGIIAVNVSALQIHQPDFVEDLARILRDTGLPAPALELELTETLALEDTPILIENLHRCQALGIRLSIDDFGTGFSSLSTLADLPIDVIKIDRSFISQADKSPKYNDILNTISELGQKLGLKIVAEGVEEIEQFELVKRMGVSSVQGYLVSRPQSSINVGNKVLRKNTANLSAAGTSAWEIEG